MQKEYIKRPEIHLVGIGLRTSYTQEVDKMQGKIWPCIQRYFQEALFEKIPHRKKPGTTFCVYTEYESDYRGAYTYFVGEEVEPMNQAVPDGLQTLIIPEQKYAKFTTGPDAMPDVIINAWGKIWAMPEDEMGGKRVYHTDYEVYDERASDHEKIVLDIYVGIQSA